MRPNFDPKSGARIAVPHRSKARSAAARRRPAAFGAAVLFGLSLTACSVPDFGSGGSGADEPLGVTVGSGGVERKAEREAGRRPEVDSSASSFAGAAVADEPRAALAAREVLEKGGNAADAAAALYFALSVTYPASAGLGGGGVCLVREPESNKVETVSFLTRRPRDGGAVAVPGNVRGFGLLQARFGSQDWSAVVAPAERLAATGVPVSRAFAKQLAAAAQTVSASDGLRHSFMKPDGGVYRELDSFDRVDLASTLALIRSRGVNGFYAGQVAADLVAASKAGGGKLSLDDLRDYRAETMPAQSVSDGRTTAHLAGRKLGAGKFADAIWKATQGVAPSALLETANVTAQRLGVPADIDRDFGSTAFATVDGQGGAVACGVTMNGAFGSALTARSSGVTLAASPALDPQGLASAFLMPLIVTSANGERVYLSGAGTGAPRGAASIAYAAQKATSATDSVARALDATPATRTSSANAVFCPSGVTDGGCSLAVNPKSDGVGVSAVGVGG
ncbi:gamma-glutamyltranspeptidase/glutathione hydrolase [Parvibaculum indicum]|uniref:gamma-glutamyltransferase n=1 Tax=Parvibaculum indicum TaxID=562969 RepID=UPI00142307FD|nr:gamma-glutamyltransferase [Parvibaculum indicum]NIJ43030.1 gamma-glutamyltranspeptidase/glutathione hydrolase [Parvibaculum indicum]